MSSFGRGTTFSGRGGARPPPSSNYDDSERPAPRGGGYDDAGRGSASRGGAMGGPTGRQYDDNRTDSRDFSNDVRSSAAPRGGGSNYGPSSRGGGGGNNFNSREDYPPRSNNMDPSRDNFSNTRGGMNRGGPPRDGDYEDSGYQRNNARGPPRGDEFSQQSARPTSRGGSYSQSGNNRPYGDQNIQDSRQGPPRNNPRYDEQESDFQQRPSYNNARGGGGTTNNGRRDDPQPDYYNPSNRGNSYGAPPNRGFDENARGASTNLRGGMNRGRDDDYPADNGPSRGGSNFSNTRGGGSMNRGAGPRDDYNSADNRSSAYPNNGSRGAPPQLDNYSRQRPPSDDFGAPDSRSRGYATGGSRVPPSSFGGNEQSSRNNSNNYGSYNPEPDFYDRPNDRGGNQRPSYTGSSRGGGLSNGNNSNGGGYDQPARGGMSNAQDNGYNPSPRGGGSTGYGGYSQSTRGGGGGGMSNNDNGQQSTRGGSASAGYAGYSTRGGGDVGGGSTRGSFISGRGGGSSRYDERRTENNGGSAGYAGYSSFTQLDSNGGNNERTAENHAPRDYKPAERNIQDIFDEDKEDVKRNTASLFDEDADIEIEEVKDQLITETWDEMELHSKLMENVIKSDYLRPRKIQQYTIPYILSDYDVKCQGETGSGKTAAFLLPVIHKMLLAKDQGQLPVGNPICLIVAPTRELTSQIYNQAQKFTYNTGITVARAYGEYMVRQNLTDIKNGCNILCACIGRLMHFVKQGEIHLREVKFLILDEADRLLMDNRNVNSDAMELFQWPDLLDKENRQTLLFSATLRDPNVMALTREYMKPDRTVMVTAKSQSNKRVRYVVYAVPSAAAKYKYLTRYMKRITEENDGVIPRTLIFVNRKVNTDRVAVECSSGGFPATTIHGDRGQHLREEALASFRSGKTKCLVATDVCARGVDIKEMDHVINYDLPNDKDSYVQRCGRTGRTHNGTAMSFYLEDEDRSMAYDIVKTIQDSGQSPPEFLSGMVNSGDYNFGEGEEAEEVYGYNPIVSNGTSNDASNDDASNEKPQEQSLQNGVETLNINDTNQDDDWD